MSFLLPFSLVFITRSEKCLFEVVKLLEFISKFLPFGKVLIHCKKGELCGQNTLAIMKIDFILLVDDPTEDFRFLSFPIELIILPFSSLKPPRANYNIFILRILS